MTLLLGQREIYREFVEMVRRNPELQQSNSFHDWLRRQYATYMALGIRRLIDQDRRTLSLFRLLQELKDNAGFLTPTVHQAMYRRSGLSSEIGTAEFRRYAIPSGGRLSKAIVRQDLGALKRACRRIKGFVDKHVAHTDRRRLRKLPTYAMLDVALNGIKGLAEKYRILVAGTGGDLTPTYLDDWQSIFRIPWIRS